MKIFCPRCGEAYVPPLQTTPLDGAFFGPTFPHLFFMTFEDEVPRADPEKFVPRIYGFRIHSSSAATYSGASRGGSGGSGGGGGGGSGGRHRHRSHHHHHHRDDKSVR